MSTPSISPEDFFASAAELLLKSSVSIAEQCREEMTDVFPPESNLTPMISEYLAFLGSIILHEARSKKLQEAAIDINQTCHALKDALARVTRLEPNLLTHAQLFDDQSFHDLMANYFNGKLEGFQFPQAELLNTSKMIGIPVPTSPGIETIFFALLVQLIRIADLKKITDPTIQKNAAARLTQLTETGISSFGLALQLLR